MHIQTAISLAGVFALGAFAQNEMTVTKTVKAQPTQWSKTSDQYSQYICDSDEGYNNCLEGNNLVPFTYSPPGTTQFNLDAGQFVYIYYGTIASVDDSTQGGNLTFLSSPTGYALQCFYRSPTANDFNCYNGRGQKLKWYKNSDSSVGLGLTVPAGTKHFQAYWIGGT